MPRFRRLAVIPMIFLVLLVPAGCMYTQITATLPSVSGRYQLFERGVMFWREDNAVIYVIADDGRFWELEAPEYGVYPDNPLQFQWDRFPKPTAQSGFGRVWWNYLDVRYAIGEALTTEINTYQPIHQFMPDVVMLVLPDSRVIFAHQTSWIQVGEDNAVWLPSTPYPSPTFVFLPPYTPTPPPCC